MLPPKRAPSCGSLLRLVLGLLLVVGIVPLSVLVGAKGASSASVVPYATSLKLSSETSWVRASGAFSIGVAVSSPLPRDALGVRFVLYSKLTNRSDFNKSVDNKEPPSELPIDTTSTFHLEASGSGLGTTDQLKVNFAIKTSGPSKGARTLDLGCTTVSSCYGVYPLQVVLVERSSGRALRSFTTHLVYLARTGTTLSLDVSLVLPLSANVALDPRDAPKFSRGELSHLATVLRLVASHVGDQLSLAAYGDLLVALTRTTSAPAKAALRALRGLVGPDKQTELLNLPFAPIDAESMRRAGLEGEVSAEFRRAKVAVRSVLRTAPEKGPYLAQEPVSAATLPLLRSEGFTKLLVDASSVRDEPNSFTPSAPISMAGPGNKDVLVGLEDPGLAAHAAPSSDEVLAAHQFLADLAMIYFEAPYTASPRGVLVVPDALPSRSFLSVVLSGMASSPVVSPVSASTYFADVPATTSPVSAGDALVAPARKDAPSAVQMNASRKRLRELASVVPSASGLLTRVSDARLLAGTASLSEAARARYLGAPERALDAVARSIHLTKTGSVTLTARTETIPITIRRGAPKLGPVHLRIKARSGTLAFPTGSVNSLKLSQTNKFYGLKVTARTSGVSELDLALVSPIGGVVLSRAVLVVRSTAVSSVAIALSIAALAVLLAWWLRSLQKTRRRRREAATAPSGT